MHAELFLWPDTACRPACAVRGWSSAEKRKAGGGGEGDEPGRRWRAGAVQGVIAGLRDPARHLRLASRHRDRFSERHSVHHRLWLRLERPAAARAQPPTDARVLSRRLGVSCPGPGALASCCRLVWLVSAAAAASCWVCEVGIQCRDFVSRHGAHLPLVFIQRSWPSRGRRNHPEALKPGYNDVRNRDRCGHGDNPLNPRPGGGLSHLRHGGGGGCQNDPLQLEN